MRTRRLKELSELSLLLGGDPRSIFERIVRLIGELFQVRVVCLSQIVERDLLFRAVYVNGQVTTDAGGCPLNITPCATVEETKDLRIINRVSELFPHAKFLRDHEANTYCGFPSLDKTGRVVAVTCLLDDQLREFAEEEQYLLRIIGQRVAMEIEHARISGEQQLSMQALRTSERRLKDAQRIGRMGSLDWDLITNQLTLSQEAVRIFGLDDSQDNYSLDQLISLLHPEERSCVEKSLTDASTGVAPHDMEHRIIRPDGKEIWIRAAAERLDDISSKPVHLIGIVQDITERKQIENSLRIGKARLNEAQRIAKVGSWELDFASSTLTWSNEIYRLFEIDPKGFTVTYEAFLNAIHPEDRTIVDVAYSTSLKTRRPYDIIHRLLMADGRIKFVRERCETYYDSAGHPLRSIGTVQDITERKLVEDQLRASETRYRVLVEQATDAIFLHGPDGVILDVNRRACESLGYSQEELVGLQVTDFDPFISTSQLQQIGEHLAAGKAIEFESCHRRKDGSTFPVEVRLNPFRLNDQQVALAIARNISDRRRIEAERRQSDVQRQLVLNNMGDGFVILNRDWQYVEVNPAGAAILGRTPDQIVNRHFREVFPEAAGSTWEKTLANVMESGVATTVEDYYEPLKLWVEARIFPFDDGISVFFTDTTARRQAADDIRELRDALAHVNRLGSLGEIASGLAHELNQPLASMHLDASTAQLLCEGVKSSDLHKCLRNIAEQSIRAGEIIRRIRSFVRRESNNKDYQDANQLIREVLQLLADHLRLNNIKVHANLTEHLPPVFVDRIQIQQVLVNLIRNAIDALSKNDKTSRLVVIRTECTENELRVSVTDNGCGINPDIRDKLFHPFETTKQSGLGLGLAICRTLVEAHGGWISAHSNSDGGSTFTFAISVSP